MIFVISIFSLALGLLGSIIWIWSIFDILRSEFKRESDKLIWLIVVLVVPVIGTFFYIFMGRAQHKDGTEEFV